MIRRENEKLLQILSFKAVNVAVSISESLGKLIQSAQKDLWASQSIKMKKNPQKQNTKTKPTNEPTNEPTKKKL